MTKRFSFGVPEAREKMVLALVDHNAMWGGLLRFLRLFRFSLMTLDTKIVDAESHLSMASIALFLDSYLPANWWHNRFSTTLIAGGNERRAI